MWHNSPGFSRWSSMRAIFIPMGRQGYAMDHSTQYRRARNKGNESHQIENMPMLFWRDRKERTLKTTFFVVTASGWETEEESPVAADSPPPALAPGLPLVSNVIEPMLIFYFFNFLRLASNRSVSFFILSCSFSSSRSSLESSDISSSTCLSNTAFILLYSSTTCFDIFSTCKLVKFWSFDIRFWIASLT